MTDNSKSEPKTFEQAMGDLESLVGNLERGDMPLDKALEAFEKGSKLVDECSKMLADAEMRVEKVMASRTKAGE